MFGGAYGDARMPNWLHIHRTALPLRRHKGEHFEAGNLSGPISLLLECFLFCCWLLTANRERGMARSGIGCLVVTAMGHLCHSHAISILQPIVKVTKAVMWSHPSALFSIIGTKLSSVRGCSLISCRVVIASSQYS